MNDDRVNETCADVPHDAEGRTILDPTAGCVESERGCETVAVVEGDASAAHDFHPNEREDYECSRCGRIVSRGGAFGVGPKVCPGNHDWRGAFAVHFAFPKPRTD